MGLSYEAIVVIVLIGCIAAVLIGYSIHSLSTNGFQDDEQKVEIPYEQRKYMREYRLRNVQWLAREARGGRVDRDVEATFPIGEERHSWVGSGLWNGFSLFTRQFALCGARERASLHSRCGGCCGLVNQALLHSGLPQKSWTYDVKSSCQSNQGYVLVTCRHGIMVLPAL